MLDDSRYTMRVIFLNLHSNNFFVTDFSRLITKKKAIDKHRFLLDYLIRNNIEVVDYISPRGSMLPGKILKKLSKIRLVGLLEAKFVFRRNGIDPQKITCVFSNDEIRSDDVAVFYSHNFDREKDIINLPCMYKIADHIHFYGQKECSIYLKNQNVSNYICEINLEKHCKLFQQQFDWFDGNFILRKFAYQNRFIISKRFSERKCRAFAIGTLTYYDGPEFVECYGTNVYQPMRKMIYDNVDYLSDQVDSYISDYNEVALKNVDPNEFFISALSKKFFNFINSGRQKNYFSFDIVEKYNEYKMFVCPEDALGFYGIGAIEGMACGCAMIGWNYGAYEDIGLVSGVHYISYDGTLEGLKKTVEFWQKDENQAKLEEIAINGYNYIKDRFSQENVAREYLESLTKLANGLEL